MFSFSPTILIIIITAIISYIAFNNGKLMGELIFHPPAVQQKKQWYRFVTCGFIHADFQHLIFNMLTLYFFGTVVEEYYQMTLGSFGFYTFYLLAIIVSEIPSYIKNRNNSRYYSLGASGGVSAVVFSYILFAPWQWFTFPPIPAILYGVGYLIYSVYMSKKQKDNINHDAHFWGAIFGIVFTIILNPKVIDYFLDQITHPKLP